MHLSRTLLRASRRWGVVFAALATASLLHATELKPFQTFQNVDYVSAGVGGTRETGRGAIELTGVNGPVQKAYLYWHGHGRAAEFNATQTTGTVALTNSLGVTTPVVVTGDRIGLSGQNGWSFSPYSYYFGAAYRADVTSLVTGNGTYGLSTFRPLATGVQGASLLVIFDDGDASNNQDIIIYDGCDQNSANSWDSSGWNISIAGVPFTAGDQASLEFHVSDGQHQYNETPILINQQQLAAWGNEFRGAAPYNNTSGFRYTFFTGTLWDINTYNIAPFLTTGANNLLITTGYDDDDLTVVATVIKLKSGGGVFPPPVNPNLPTVSCPTAVNITASGAVNHTATVTVGDLDGDALTVVWRVNGVEVRQDQVPAGSPTTAATLSLTQSYAAGSYNIVVTVIDSKGGLATCSALLTVSTPPPPVVNRPPVAQPDSGSTRSGVPVTIASLTNDSDPDRDPIRITTFTQPPQGTVTLGADGKFTYTPPATFIGNVTFTYTITDDKSGTSTTTVTISVVGNPPNNPPVAQPDEEATEAGVPVTVDSLVNDSDPDGDLLTIVTFTQPEVGTVTLGLDNKFVYTSPDGFNGTIVFEYTITDGRDTSTTTVTIVVTDPELPPAGNECSTTGLYPIALHISTVQNAAIGTIFTDIWNGALQGNFGWLTWAGDPNEGTLQTSLTAPGDSHTYINPADRFDYGVSVGDWVHGATGVKNSSSIRAALDALKTRDIMIPIWDAARLQGRNTDYRIVAFAKVRILDYRLPSQNRITAQFLGMVDCTTPPRCELYPIAVSAETLRNVAVGTEVRDVLNGVQPGNFGWLAWRGEANSQNLLNGLIPPGDSHFYRNPDAPFDYVLDIGEWVEGDSGLSNTSDIRAALERLKLREIVVPVWDQARRTGNNSAYRVVNFARIQITSYHLPGQNRISARFLGYTSCPTNPF
ncbi:MAG TPA: Ig-like domain-containing protein [Methylomirabilota bacterium]|nr:Ig-like domain-containing protein [Methylomirabilota bacterium]